MWLVPLWRPAARRARSLATPLATQERAVPGGDLLPTRWLGISTLDGGTPAVGIRLVVIRLAVQGAHSTEAVLQHIGQTGPKAMCWSGPGLQTGPKARCWPVLCAAAHSQYWVLVWSGHPAHSYCHVLVCVPASTAHSLLPTPSLPNGVVNGKIVLIGDKHNRGTNTIFKAVISIGPK